MHRRPLHLAAAVLALALPLTACSTTGTPGPRIDTPAPAARTGTLPDFVGQGLQAAQDGAQKAGFSLLKSHDASGRGRAQVLDRSWKVCSQTPKPGAHPTRTTVDFGTVKTEETCPSSDAGVPPKPGTTMPNLVGKSVKVARESLPQDARIELRDASGQNRMILVGSNWRVCTVSPKPGADLTGQQIVIGAVKFTESC
ncbi:hypothetical protein ACIO3O_35010 [Streptomyces sp. NPDC087440]|uniref:hypothetical protein n=1 Tax=Streptomyces sp. NPDC087440 TaxID=3365790 RepID=UPI00382439DF